MAARSIFNLVGTQNVCQVTDGACQHLWKRRHPLTPRCPDPDFEIAVVKNKQRQRNYFSLFTALV